MRAATLMVQGTTSDAGKSLLVTALCRWLVRQGVKVAPFKPRNMALDSAVAVNGGEVGRSQMGLVCLTWRPSWNRKSSCATWRVGSPSRMRLSD